MLVARRVVTLAVVSTRTASQEAHVSQCVGRSSHKHTMHEHKYVTEMSCGTGMHQLTSEMPVRCNTVQTRSSRTRCRGTVTENTPWNMLALHTYYERTMDAGVVQDLINTSARVKQRLFKPSLEWPNQLTTSEHVAQAFCASP